MGRALGWALGGPSWQGPLALCHLRTQEEGNPACPSRFCYRMTLESKELNVKSIF